MDYVSILVAHPFPFTRRGVQSLLESRQGWKIVGEAGSGSDAVAQAQSLRPDLVLMDLAISKLNALDAARLILQTLPNTQVLLLGKSFSPEIMDQALEAGVRACILSGDAEADLITAIRTVLRHEVFFSAGISSGLFESSRGFSVNSERAALTEREKQIIQLLAQGNSNKQAAEILRISPRTVENYRAEIMRKLGLRSFSELVRYAIRNRIITV